MKKEFSYKLLKYLNEYSKNGEYVVVSFGEIENLFQKYKITNNDILSALNFLTQNEYIKIRYKDEEEICYCSLVKARLFCENYEKNGDFPVKSNKNTKFLILNIIFCGISAFFGAFLAIMLIHFFF